MSHYCDTAPGHPQHGPYHDHEYGFPIHTENELFERLALEINQAGLSWLTVLKKRGAFHSAFDGFEVDRVAAYGDSERERLLNNAAIIRNRLKINAVIHNASVIQQLRDSHGGFHQWLEHHHPLPHSEWVKLFRRTFRFTGPEIVREMLMSTGYLPGAHRDDCPVQQRIIAAGPAWARPNGICE
ncbi:DNA-3-methyladenine glycosylase I [Halomonas halocynthiae]|uniref:DNA-3-methyladenine glycosylase I n=1 Tax=Halomonas halocynthiae TaxID=176290 RepID=UPI0003F71C50|nr:DNA-3-methyladenine glycosylase I [Halomonas halocynthiae]